MTTRQRLTHWRSLSTAFMAWLVHQPEEVRFEIIATKRKGRVNIRFPRFRTLRGRIRNHCLAIYADDDRGENYDRIFDVDCLPIWLEGADAFECGFCEGERERFGSREALWEDHLFKPFGEWVETKLLHADGVKYERLGGVTWAKLHMPDSPTTVEDDEWRTDDHGVEHLRFYRRARSPPQRGTC